MQEGGDGIVGNRDLVIAKLYDKDGDGRLNTGERNNAMEAIRNVSCLFFITDRLENYSTHLLLGLGHRRENGLECGAVGRIAFI